jgi:hypothetical protein
MHAYMYTYWLRAPNRYAFFQDEETGGSISSDFLYSADGWKKAGKDAARVEMLHAPMLVQVCSVWVWVWASVYVCTYICI